MSRAEQEDVVINLRAQIASLQNRVKVSSSLLLLILCLLFLFLVRKPSQAKQTPFFY
uniref:Uncharacterized protein n=1 Tax=Rhizophora mucronata TaxID=61149 RepID=A0A2P2LQL2_RHIMU